MMARAIDADLALHTLSVYSATEMVTWERTKDVAKGYDASAVTVGYMQGIKDALAVLHDMPTIEAEPVKHGKWEFGRQNGAAGYWCTNCKSGFTGENAEWIAKEHYFCPKCGADMRGDQE